MLAPLVIYLVLCYLIRDKTIRFASTVLIFFFMIGMMIPTQAMRAKWYEANYFNVKLPNWVNDTKAATVLVAFPAQALYTNPRPQTYLIPFFPKEWRFVGIPFVKFRYTMPPEIFSLIEERQLDQLFLLSSADSIPQLYEVSAQLGFKHPKLCEPITSDRQYVTHLQTWLCVVSR